MLDILHNVDEVLRGGPRDGRRLPHTEMKKMGSRTQCVEGSIRLNPSMDGLLANGRTFSSQNNRLLPLISRSRTAFA